VRNAFGLIELLFAIIVMSVAMLAIPPILEQTTSNINEILKQEAIFQAYRTIYTIETYKWDEKTTLEGSTSTGVINIPHILDTTNGDTELNRTNPASVVRQGNFNVFTRRTFFPSPTYASTTLGLDAGETQKDDIDDFNGNIDIINKSTGNFVIDMRIRQNIYYISDNTNYSANNINININATPATASTNIKMIDINVTDASGGAILVMRGFTCNIGAAPLLKKDAL